MTAIAIIIGTVCAVRKVFELLRAMAPGESTLYFESRWRASKLLIMLCEGPESHSLEDLRDR
jgi:hypothetical protein